MINYSDSPSSLATWDAIFFLLAGRLVTESDVWSASLNMQTSSMPEFHNVHMGLVFEGIKSILSPHSIDVSYIANSLDSHLYIASRSISDLDEYNALCTELLCAGAINKSQQKLLLGETPIKNYQHEYESDFIAPFSELALGSRFKFLDVDMSGVWVKLGGDGRVAAWNESQQDTRWEAQKVVSLNDNIDFQTPVQVVA